MTRVLRCVCTTMLLLFFVSVALGQQAQQQAQPLQLANDFQLVVFDHKPTARDFVLRDRNGDNVSLSDFSGQYVLLNFWATWCPPCVRELPSLQQLHTRFAQQKSIIKTSPTLVVVAVSSDKGGVSTVQPFLDKLKINFPVLIDQTSEVATKYGANLLPVSFIIGPTGQVLAAAQGERDWASNAASDAIDQIIATQQ